MREVRGRWSRGRSRQGRYALLFARMVGLAILVVVVASRPAPSVAGEDGSLTIDAPEEGQLVAARFQVAGRAPVIPPPRQAVLRVNGTDVEVKDGRFAVDLEGRDGPFRVRVVFAEIGAPAQVAERVVTVDAAPPVIELEQPSEEVGTLATDEAVVRGVARDRHLARVLMNDNEVAVHDDGTFEAMFLLPPSAPLEVIVEAIDAVGNRSSVRRVLRRGNGPPPSEQPAAVPSLPPGVEDALGWLAAHQSADGGWDADGFGGWCRGARLEAATSDGAGKFQYGVGVTGLALLAFLRAGYTPRSDGEFGRVVEKGLRYLKGVQDAEGCFGSRATGHYVYNHAIAALAMIEATGSAGGTAFRSSAQKAVDFIALTRNPQFAWRYGVKPGDNDTSVTGWMTMAIASARRINGQSKGTNGSTLRIDEDALAGIKAWIDKMTDPESGRVGYQQRGTGPARPTELVDKFPAGRSESMTAVGMLARIAVGEDPRTSSAIRKGAALCGSLLPTWNTADGSIDMYYWYYATHALSAVGGPVWDAWRSRLTREVLSHQRKDGDYCGEKGSWDPVDPWGPDGGRVYSTSILALALEIAGVVAAAAPPPSDSLEPRETPANGKERLGRLKDRASRWAVLRHSCLSVCDRCEGRGEIRGGSCSRCNAAGKLYNSKLRDAYVGMRSPAWRARSTADAEFRAFYRRLWQRSIPSVALSNYRIGALNLVDESHAIVELFENGAATATSVQWIWSSEPAFPKGTWYLYSQEVDGDWP